jgi:hypothetical protein
VGKVLGTPLDPLVADSIRPHPGAQLFEPQTTASFLGAAAFLTLVSAFSVGAAFALRGPVAGIIATLVILLAIPAVLTLTHADWATQLAAFLPKIGGPVIFGQGPLDPWASAAIAGFWTMAMLGLGAISVRRQDS